jgi:hypothetical protein
MGGGGCVRAKAKGTVERENLSKYLIVGKGIHRNTNLNLTYIL